MKSENCSHLSTRSKIILMRKAGKKITEISRELGLQRSTIYRWIERWEKGDTLENKCENYKRGSIAERGRIILLKKTGKSITEISKELNITRSTVYRWVARWEANQNLQDNLRGRTKTIFSKTNDHLPKDFVHRHWTPEETTLLLSLVAQYYNVLNIGFSKKVEECWKIISHQLSQTYGKISWRQSYYRWNTLRMKYMIYEKVRMTSPEDQQMPEYYAELCSIIGSQNIVFEQPEHILSDSVNSNNIISMATNTVVGDFFEVNTHTEWQSSEVYKLLELIKLNYEAAANRGKRIKDVILFNRITEQLCNATGKNVTPKQVCQKWRNLQRSYVTYEDSRLSFTRCRKRKSDFHKEIGETLAVFSYHKRSLVQNTTNEPSPTTPVPKVLSKMSGSLYRNWDLQEIQKLIAIVDENCDSLTNPLVEKDEAWDNLSDKWKEINANINGRSAFHKWEELVMNVRRHKKNVLKGDEHCQEPLFFHEVEAVLQKNSEKNSKNAFKKILPKDPVLILTNHVSKKYQRLKDPMKAPLAWQEIYSDINKMFPFLSLDDLLKLWTNLKEDFVAYETFQNLQVIRKPPPYYESIQMILIENQEAELPSASYCQPISGGSWSIQNQKQSASSSPLTFVLSLNNGAVENKSQQVLVGGDVVEALVEEPQSKRPRLNSESNENVMTSLNRLCSLVEDMNKSRMEIDNRILSQQQRQNEILEKLFEVLNKNT